MAINYLPPTDPDGNPSVGIPITYPSGGGGGYGTANPPTTKPITGGNTVPSTLGYWGQIGSDPRGYTTIGGGTNYLGQKRPDYASMSTAEGTLDPRFQQTLGTSFSALRDKAMAEGDTAGATIARQRLGQDLAASRDQLAKQNLGSVSQARSNLAMRGGLRGGAAERLGQMGIRNQMMGNQALGREGMRQNLNISLNDEQLKNQLLGQVGGVEQGAQRENVRLLAQDLANQNRYLGGLYAEDAKALAAQKSAEAQASGAGGDSFNLLNPGTWFG